MLESNKSEYSLSIRFASDGFSLSVLDGAAGMVLMRREVQAAVFGLPKEELLALLAREVEALLAGCAEVSLCVEADGYVLVPDALFRPRQLDDYFYFQHERDDRGLVLFDRVPRWGCVNVFSMPGVLYESLSEFFPDASPKHHVTGFLSRLGRERESQVALWMRTGCVDVAVVSGGRLLLANRFACHAVEDVVYFALNCFEQFNLGVGTTPVTLYQHNKSTECRDLLAQYVEQCEVVEVC